MEIRLGGLVRRVTVLERDGSGGLSAVTLYRKKKAKKKGTRLLRPLARSVRRSWNAQRALADTYLSRHDKSNRKKKDGWVRDLGLNLTRANRKGVRKLRLNRWFLA
jgi:hypothetical protein